jgi:integrating conjugative element membrane protein (TIGR03747 family)
VASKDIQFGASNFAHSLLWPFKLSLKLVLTPFCTGLFAIALYWVVMQFWWQDRDAVAQAQAIFNDAAAMTQEGGWARGNAWLATRMAEWVYAFYFKLTYVHQAMMQFSNEPPKAGLEGALDAIYYRTIIQPYTAQLQVAALAVQTAAVRFAILITSMPLFLLAYGAGFVDGLVQRYIRRESAGRESSGLYHRAKYGQLMICVFLIMAYLCVPFSVDARWFVISLACTLGLLSRLQWLFYKKYL